MGDSLDRLFLFPRTLLASRRVDLYDAINLVIYAKLPLISARRGNELVAGFIRRDGVRVSPALLSARQKNELLNRYGSEIASFRYPIGPSQYEPLLEKIVEADDHAVPYFFHEHHELRERERRAAMFADLHGELAGLVSKKEVAIQLTESERTYVMDGGAWMTAQTLRAFLERHGVTPWWETEDNLQSHARLERLLLSDALGVSRSGLSDGYDERQLPSYLFGRMLLARTNIPRGFAPVRAPTTTNTSVSPTISDQEFASSNYKPGLQKYRKESFPMSAHSTSEGTGSGYLQDPSEAASTSTNSAHPSLNKENGGTRAKQIPGDRNQESSEKSSAVIADDPDDEMLTKRGVANLLGVKSTTTVDNYRDDFEDFPEAVVYGANTLRWRKSDIERWKKARPAR